MTLPHLTRPTRLAVVTALAVGAVLGGSATAQAAVPGAGVPAAAVTAAGIRTASSGAALPAGLDPRAVAAAARTGWAADASMSTRMLYLLHRDPSSGRVVVSAATRTSFGGCNRDGCFATPKGLFHVTRKGGADYRSNQWKGSDGRGARMPWPVFFTGGVAIHDDPLGASHECVHVPSMALAKTFHDLLPIGATVVVH